MSDNLIGTYIGEYEIIGQLGIGGMGVVYKARQHNLMREVAMKLLPKEYGLDPEYIERFLREARAAARLNHPNIVQVYDAGVFEGQYFFVMELVVGRNAGEIIRDEKRISERDATRIVLQAALGLGFAHHAGIIHRDVKPENLILNSQGTVKICDLGLAKWGFSSVDKRITQAGMTLGTPYYIAPEQVKGVDVDHRADIYALGASFYHLLTGQKPFDGENYAAIMLSHLKKPLPDPRLVHPDLSEESVFLMNRMTEKSLEKRFQSMDEVVDAACQIIGVKDIEGMVSPEVAKRLAQRFMERRSRSQSRTTAIVEAEKKKARLAAWAAVGILLVGAAAGWSYYHLSESERELVQAQRAIREQTAHKQRARSVQPIEIAIPTEEAPPLAPAVTNKTAVTARETPEPRLLFSEPPLASSPAPAGEPQPPAPAAPARPKQLTLEIPGYLLWQASIHPSMTSEEKKSMRIRRLAKAGETNPPPEPGEIPQLVQVSSEWRGLMKFDVQQLIRSEAGHSDIDRAWLVLTPAVQKIKTGNFDIEVFRMLRPWGRTFRKSYDLNDSNPPRPEIRGVSWEQAEPRVPWGFEGADKEGTGKVESGTAADRMKTPTAVATLTSASPREPVKLDVTQDIRAWLYGNPNYGWLFVGKGFGTVEFFPGGDDTGRGPKLILVFE